MTNTIMNNFLLQAGGGSPFNMVIMMVLIFGVMYFFMIRPQQKKTKELQKLRDALKKDDAVVTAGGIHGVVMEVKDDVVIIAVESAAKIKVDKASIAVINGVAGPVRK